MTPLLIGLGLVVVLLFVAMPLFHRAARPHRGSGSPPPRPVRIGSHHIPAIDWNPEWSFPPKDDES